MALRLRECSMRLAFWRAGKDKAVVERAVAKAAAKRAELEPRIEAAKRAEGGDG